MATATSIATSRGPSPMTVRAFERFGLGRGAAIPGVGGGVGFPGPELNLSSLTASQIKGP